MPTTKRVVLDLTEDEFKALHYMVVLGSGLLTGNVTPTFEAGCPEKVKLVMYTYAARLANMNTAIIAALDTLKTEAVELGLMEDYDINNPPDPESLDSTYNP